MYYSILDRYIGRTIFYNITIVLFILVSLSTIIRFIDELRKVGQGNYGIVQICVYVFLSLVKDIELFFPVAILLGTVLGLGVLSLRNELIIMEVFGCSRLRIISSLMKNTVPIILFSMFINEWIAPIGERIARDYRYKMINNVVNVVYKHVWIKDGNNFIYIEKIIKHCELLGVHIYHFGIDKRLKLFRYAVCAKFMKSHWNLLCVSKLYFHDVEYIVKKQLSTDIWLTNINPNYILMVVRSMYYPSSSLSISDLYRCIHFFTEYEEGSVFQYQLYFWRRLFFPLSVIAMVLIALSCIMKSSLCELRVGLQILIGIVYSFFFIF